jgi:CheY-like chemotaxis protein
MAACQILGDIGSEKLLVRGGEVASPLAKAVANGDRRIRFRAVHAVLNMQPTQAFVGSSHVTEALGYFSAATGARRVLIVHPRSQLGQQLAGMLREQGFEADLATTGRDAFRLATTVPDYEFALVHMAVGNPRVEELLAQFRRDRRSARLPVGIVAVADNTQPAVRLAGYAQPATALVHPAGLAPMQRESAMLLGKVARDLVPVEVRQYQAEVTLDHVVSLASSSQKVFDMRQLIPAVEQSLRNPRLAVRAALILGHLGSANGQRSLVALAARSTQPLAVREAAVTAFQGSVLRHGLLLTKDEVQSQYNQYNINAGRDQNLHRLLATILDTIEGSPTATNTGQEANDPASPNL